MRKKIILINPNLVFQRNDPFTTGIVYMPIGLAYVTAALREAGFPVKVIDAFAEKPRQSRRNGEFTILGLSEKEVLGRISDDANIVFIFAINLTNHIASENLVRAIKRQQPDLPVVILENTQAVTAYALEYVRDVFFDAGVDYVLTGEAERQAVVLARVIDGQNPLDELDQLTGLGSPSFFNPPEHFIQDLDSLPLPAWDLFPLENYWNLRFAHGPQHDNRYLPLLTSRGCPYPCLFCVVPATNQQNWRARSAINVVDEIEHHVNNFGVHEFHIEDLDPTISDTRIREIANEIIRRELKISWKIVAGTKIETIRSEETLDLMAQSGCRYISISPETGSPRVLKLMRKPFNLDHAVRMVRRMNQLDIHSQACFVLGFPGETAEDLKMTWNLVHDLTRKGVDEIALFIITPVPGSAIYEEFQGYKSLSELNFTPTWRMDYQYLSKFRLKLYVCFLFWKIWYHPLKVFLQTLNFLRRRFETKMEMVPYRALMLILIDVKSSRNHETT